MFYLIFYMLLIYTFHFSTDEHLEFSQRLKFNSPLEQLTFNLTYSIILNQGSEILVNLIGTLIDKSILQIRTCKILQNV